MGDHSFKVIVLGEPNIGKTSLIKKYVSHQFQTTYIPTIGIDISKQPVTVTEAVKVDLILWDLAGQSTFAGFHNRYFNGADGVLIGFDLTRPKTYASTRSWHKKLVERGMRSIPTILFGNKADLTNKRRVPPENIEKLKNEFGLTESFETSANTGDHVTMMFETIAKMICSKRGLI